MAQRDERQRELEREQTGKPQAERRAGQQTARELLAFLEGSPTAFHAAAQMAERLERHGFRRLSEPEP